MYKSWISISDLRINLYQLSYPALIFVVFLICQYLCLRCHSEAMQPDNLLMPVNQGMGKIWMDKFWIEINRKKRTTFLIQMPEQTNLYKE